MIKLVSRKPAMTVILKKLILPAMAILWAIAGFGQTVNVDLLNLVNGKTVKTYNRELTIVSSGPKGPYIHLSESNNAGLAWLEGLAFTNGTIEFDLKGRNVLQKSFVGFAFHGSSDSTYDAIYFRPFNFKSAEEERRNHSLQYISLPGFDWPKLRAEFPNKYEQPISPPPGPDEWVHCRLEVSGKEIKVFVNANSAPSLVVTALKNQTGKKLGFWVGNGSDGDFANLKVSGK
jgi:hypothetical protein